jgi:serine protease
VGATEQRAQLANQARLALSSGYALTTLEAAGGAGPDLLLAREGVDVDALVARLAADPLVAAVQRNYYVELQWNGGLPADPLYGAQWSLAEFGVPEAWAALTAPAQRHVVLAVLDSGVDSHHPDLAAKVLPGYDFFRNSPITDPPPVMPGTGSFGNVAHGTHVAGIAAALGDDVGVIGVAFAPEVQLLPVKLFDDCGERGRVDTLVKAIRWATGLPVAGAPLNENPANIINLSLGVPGRHAVLDDTTAEAWAAGVLLVAASGNNSGGVLSPANGPDVLAVGSVDQDRSRSAFSNYGPGLDLMAPGGFGTPGGEAELACAASGSASVISTVPQLPDAPPELGYACFAGTSMAAPFVSGVAALLFAQDATRTAADVRELLRSTTLFEAHMNGYEYGAGIVCADAALGAATQCGSP